MERNCRIKIYGWIFCGSFFVHNIPWLVSIFTGWIVSLFAQTTAWNLNQTEIKKMHSFRWRFDLSVSCTSIIPIARTNRIYKKSIAQKGVILTNFEHTKHAQRIAICTWKTLKLGEILSDPYGNTVKYPLFWWKTSSEIIWVQFHSAKPLCHRVGGSTACHATCNKKETPQRPLVFPTQRNLRVYHPEKKGY